jgi:hypothetical protein
MYRSEGVKRRKLQEGQTLDRWDVKYIKLSRERCDTTNPLPIFLFSFSAVGWCKFGYGLGIGLICTFRAFIQS